MRKQIPTVLRLPTVGRHYPNTYPAHPMNNIVYIIGAVVIIVVVLKVLGLF